MPARFSWSMALLLFAAAALYLLGNHRAGLWDRDEPRYAQTSRQMLLSQPPDWIVPRLYHDVRTAKPILIYWCQAAAMSLAGPTPFAARLPSVLSMLATLAVAGGVIGRFAGWRRGFWTAAILATSALCIGVAKLAIIDALLLLWVAIAQLCLCAIYLGNRSRAVALLLWGAVGVASLAKGPAILAVQVSTLLALAALDVGRAWRSLPAWRDAIRWWIHLRPLLGLVVVAAIVGPWLIAIHHRHPPFLRQTLGHDILRRSTSPLEGHRGPPGFYLFTLVVTYLPWSLLIPMAAASAWRRRRLSPVRFAIAATLGPWLVMELVQTKLVHYILPAFPALAFLTADLLVHRMQRPAPPRSRFALGAAAWATLVTFIGLLPLAGAIAWQPGDAALRSFSILIALLTAAYAFGAGGLLRRGRWATAAALMACGMMLITGLFYAAYVPRARFLWMPQRIASIIRQAPAPAHPQNVAAVGYDADSLAFYLGSPFHPTSPERLHQSRAPWLVISRAALNRLPAHATARWREVACVQGWDYVGSGQWIELVIARRDTVDAVAQP